MISLVFVFSTCFVYSSSSPSKREADPGLTSYGPGAQCHNKKYIKCLKIPKHDEYDKCEDIIDTTYIEECEHVIETHCEKEIAHVYDSHAFTLDSHVPKCHDKESKVCHKIPKKDIFTECRKVVEFGHDEKCEEIVTRHCDPFDCGFRALKYCKKLV